MRWPVSLRARRLAAVLAPLAEVPEDMVARAAGRPPLDIWPVYERPRRDARSPYEEDGGRAIDDMVVSLVNAGPRSTTEALAQLRQVFPKYPLALRLAAVVAYMKTHPNVDAAAGTLPQPSDSEPGE
jgi:hypothetical protein